MSGTIYYVTKYGSTQDYARWLSEETGFEMKNIGKRPETGPERIAIIGTNLLMGKATAGGWLKKNWSQLKGKSPVLFCVGSSKPNEREDILKRSIPQDMRDGLKVFHLPGRIDHRKLGYLMSRLFTSFAKYEKDETKRRRAIEGYDDVRRENLSPIIAHIKGLIAQS